MALLRRRLQDRTWFAASCCGPTCESVQGAAAFDIWQYSIWLITCQKDVYAYEIVGRCGGSDSKTRRRELVRLEFIAARRMFDTLLICANVVQRDRGRMLAYPAIAG